MRPYPPNSPQAQTRVIVLGMLIDGAADPSEYALVAQDETLRIEPGQIDTVIQELYEDLDLGGSMTRTLDQRLCASDLSRMLGEISDPLLQQRLLRLLMRIAVANDELSPGEARLIREALLQWCGEDSPGAVPVSANRPRRRSSDRNARLN